MKEISALMAARGMNTIDLAEIDELLDASIADIDTQPTPDVEIVECFGE